MKLNTKLDHLRRSPRLNPPPRRSPRIKELLSNPESDELEKTSSSEGTETLRSRRPASLGSETLPSTPSNNVKTKKVKSAVQFRRKTVKVVQSFDGADPPSRVRRASGKRLFESNESGEGRAKRIKNGGGNVEKKRNERVVILAKALIIVGSLLVTGSVGAFVGKVVLKW